MNVENAQGKVNSETAYDPSQYFRAMSQFVGFTEEHRSAIKESQFIIEKHIPTIVGKFYDHLLRYPPTRKYFLDKQGNVDQEHLQLRMHHLTNFWRRTAAAEYDDDFARYVDYVGRAHTSQGADPKIYIPERYVIGQVGFVQHAISEALHEELHEIDPKMEARVVKAWNLLLMVILELLSSAYDNERKAEPEELDLSYEEESVHQLAVETYERNLGLFRSIEYSEVFVGKTNEIPEGERKIIEVNDLSIGVFHHEGDWYAVRNYCLHRGGPIATGTLTDDTLTCPWHGYQFNLCNGELLMDPSASLETFEVAEEEGELYVKVPRMVWDQGDSSSNSSTDG
jgi:nitrite reductase/ring-hydroxylating ferredoxin subunit/hemoglobin-like flavoprotein